MRLSRKNLNISRLNYYTTAFEAVDAVGADVDGTGGVVTISVIGDGFSDVTSCVCPCQCL